MLAQLSRSYNPTDLWQNASFSVGVKLVKPRIGVSIFSERIVLRVKVVESDLPTAVISRTWRHVLVVAESSYRCKNLKDIKNKNS